MSETLDPLQPIRNPIDHTKDNAEAMLYRAATIKDEINKLQAEYDMLAPAILTRVKEFSASNEKYTLQVGELGTFIIAKFRKWEYSDTVKQFETELKNLQKTEQADGTAKVSESEVLKFNIKKNETKE